MAAVFHSVLGCRTERGLFGTEALKSRWQSELFQWHICQHVLLGLPRQVRGVCVSVCVRSLSKQHTSEWEGSQNGFDWSLCLSGLETIASGVSVGQGVKRINKPTVLIDLAHKLVHMSPVMGSPAFTQAYFYLEIHWLCCSWHAGILHENWLQL